MLLRRAVFAALLLIVISTLGCARNAPLPNPATLTGPQLAHQITGQSVALLSPINSAHAICSATWVSKDTILTAHHCVEGYARSLHRFQIFQALVSGGMPKLIAFIISGQDPDDLEDDSLAQQALIQANLLFPMPKLQGLVMSYVVPAETTDLGVKPLAQHHATAFALYPSLDLALLRASADLPAHGIARLATATPAVGEDISFVGSADSTWWTYRRTVVTAYRQDMTHVGMDTEGPFMQIQGEVHPGDSGSGDFNDRGQLVGINIFENTDTHFAFCVHLDHLRGVLQAQKIVPIVLTPTLKQDPTL